MRVRFIFCLLAAGAGVAAADPVKLLPTPLELPDRIGPLANDGKPHEYEDPRLGRSYGYRANGLILTVYVYDKGMAPLPDGGESLVACREVEQVKGEIMRTPSYQNVRLEREQLVRLSPPADQPLAREVAYRLELNSAPSYSYVWLTIAHRHFVKIRFSAAERLRDELRDARRAILSALGAALAAQPAVAQVAATPATAAAPADPVEGERKADQTLSINGNLPEKDKALALAYLMELSSALLADADAKPTCGGEFVPAFAVEADAYRGLVRISRESKGRTKYERTLRKIEDAGFLDEFVWVYLHRAIWGGTAPGGLTLDEFERWRKKNLKRFEPLYFGHVAVPAPRVLPIEPLE